MQNKGFVKFLAVALTLICLFYLSFSIVTSRVDSKLEEMRAVDPIAAQAYEDSLNSEGFYLGYNLKECRETAIGLGLDLKGGMNAILEVSAPDVLETLAGTNAQDPTFKEAIAAARKTNEADFIAAFASEFKRISPNGRLAQFFATQKLSGRVNTNSSDNEVIDVLQEELSAAVDNTIRVLRTRIDRFGVVQPNIQKIEGQGGRILVELPGIKEADRAKKLLSGSANLQFWTTYDAVEIIPLLSQLNNQLAGAAEAEEADESEEATAENEAEATEEESKAEETTDTKSDLLKQASNKDAEEKVEKNVNPLFSVLMPNPYQSGCLVGYAAVTDTARVDSLLRLPEAQQILPSDVALLWGQKGISKAEMDSLTSRIPQAKLQFGDRPRDGYIYELYAINLSSGQNGHAPLEGDVVTESKADFDQHGNPVVTMKMNPDGSRIWAALTEANVNHCVAVVLDGQVYSAPNVKGKIDGGSTEISGNFTLTETKDLANVLSSGRMPAPAKLISDETVGPTLGQQSINAGLTSFIIAFFVLMIYMCLMYGMKAGMVANLALILNFFFTIGILTSFQAALTMSGIAGMVLTLGMAVDANVLIYERTKEEMRAGKNIKSAVAAGYNNAFSAIFDSNLTSIITGIILYYFGTGPIRGFATTLIIGIVCSFFTAVWLTRIVYEHFLNREKWTNLTFTTKISKNLMQGTKYNFMGIYKRSYTFFAILIIVFVTSLVMRGLSPSIDFTGGRNYQVEFAQQVEPEQARAELRSTFEKLNKSDENVTTSVIAIGTEGKQLRVSTNYRYNDTEEDVDQEIEAILYEKFCEMGMLDKNQVTLEEFVNRDIRKAGSIISSQKVGAAIASDITRGAIISVILALIAIFLYILLRFRNVAYSVGSIIALTIDTFLIIGMYSICYGWIGFSLDIDQTFIGAILTAIGYSINDKVVIFDRIRENFKLYPKRDNQRLFNESLNSTLARTINTSVSTLIVLLAIFIFGGEAIRSFAFAMILGVIFGTCSSIFIAAPTAYLVMGRKIKEVDVEEEATEVKK